MVPFRNALEGGAVSLSEDCRGTKPLGPGQLSNKTTETMGAGEVARDGAITLRVTAQAIPPTVACDFSAVASDLRGFFWIRLLI